MQLKIVIVTTHLPPLPHTTHKQPPVLTAYMDSVAYCSTIFLAASAIECLAFVSAKYLGHVAVMKL
jgi:hypothetical protein